MRPLWLPCRLLLITFAITDFTIGCLHGPWKDTGSSALVFVTIPEKFELAIYRDGAAGSARPLQVIDESPNRPVDCSVNLAGEVHVANQDGNVLVFGAPPGSKYKLIKHYNGPNTRLQHPTAIVVNKVGSFYVADTGDGKPRVEWFVGGAFGNLFPNRVIEGAATGIRDPRGVAIDGSGRLFVSDRAAHQILVFDPNAEGDAAPLAHIDGLKSPGHLAVDDLLNVYVANEGNNSIAVFGSNGPENWALTTTITNKDLVRPSGIAIGPDGEIAAGALSGAWFFGADAHGDADPLRVLRGPGPMNPGGICIH